MDEKIYVCCHAPSLALLLFENACSSKHQKGLLLGSVKRHFEISTTDENEAKEEKRTLIYIEHCVPITEESIFGPYGELRESFYTTYGKDCRDKIVGWYSYRRNVKMTRCTLQESLIHKSLLSSLENVKMETFPLALLSASTLDSMSTHSFSQTFLRLNHRNAFEHMRLKIYNLSDKVTSSSGYILNTSFPMSESFEQLTKSLDDDLGVRWVKKAQHVMTQQLLLLNKELYTSENERLALEAEVAAIRAKLSFDAIAPEKYNVGPRKEPLPLRFVRYDPNVQYGRDRVQNPMHITDDEEDEEDEEEEEAQCEAVAPDVQLREITKSLLQSEAVKKLTQSPSARSYAAAATQRFGSGGDVSSHSQSMEH